MTEERPIIWITVENAHATEIPIIRDKVASVLKDEYRVIASPKSIQPINAEDLILILQETIQSLRK